MEKRKAETAVAVAAKEAQKKISANNGGKI